MPRMDSDIACTSNEHYQTSGPFYNPPPATPIGAGSMNYSPRHSHKPASLSNSRNINMKNLSLNISPPNTISHTTSSTPKRNRPPALSIPSAEGTPTRTCSVQGMEHHRDSLERKVHERPSQKEIPANRETEATATEDRASKGGFGKHILGNGAGVDHGAVSPPNLPSWQSVGGDSLQSPFGSISQNYSNEDDIAEKLRAVDLIDDTEIIKEELHESEDAASEAFHSRNESYTFTIPEELQESSMVYAYPEGPANALNSRLFLFSDPNTSEYKVDINDYDLVVNVAKECADLADTFDTKGGSREYLWVPWSHTSKISHDLPEITKLIEAMDQPGKKILVHCQCGVSRSACVVVAYFMTKFGLSVNEAYELLKSGTRGSPHTFVQEIGGLGNVVDACDRICPNMSLIFELMDFGERL